MPRPLPRSFYRRPAEIVARELLGCRLVRRTAAGERMELAIVETEAYLGAPDLASHARGGLRSRRNRSLWLDGGFAYVYRIYGLHHCLNAVTGRAADGSAVLIRAGEPLSGLATMARLRGLSLPARPGALAGGPGKLCQALAVDLTLDGAPLDRRSLGIYPGEPVPEEAVRRGPRVGVEYAGDHARWPLRFLILQ